MYFNNVLIILNYLIMLCCDWMFDESMQIETEV